MNARDTFSDWRAGLRSVAEQQLSFMLEHGLYSDCTFTLTPERGEPREFRLHRHVLARSSEVFEAMLLPSGGRMLEAQTGQVTITDIQPDIFHMVLKFIYTGDVSALCGLPMAEVLGMSGVADKYRILQLQAVCEQRLCELLVPSCVWRLLGLCGTLQGYGALQEKCVQLLRSDTPACLRSSDFVHATEESVVLLLQQNQLKIESEMPLVLAAVSWAREQSARLGASVRALLEPRVLPLLRLLSMSDNGLEIVCGLTESWLTESERVAVKARTLAALPECFCKNLAKRAVTPSTDVIPATMPSEEIYYVDRQNSRIATEVPAKDRNNRILVEVSTAVWLRAIFFSTLHYEPGRPVNEFSVTVSSYTAGIHLGSVLLDSSVVWWCHNIRIVSCNDVENKYFFPKPVRLLPGQTYSIDINGGKGRMWELKFRQQSLKEVVYAGLDTRFTFNRRGTAFDSVISGTDILNGLLFTL